MGQASASNFFPKRRHSEAGLGYPALCCQDWKMANSSKPKSPAASAGVTASGIVEAVTQDVELSMDQVKVAAHDAIAAVEKKLGLRKPEKKPKARVAASKAKATSTIKPRALKPAKKSKA